MHLVNYEILFFMSWIQWAAFQQAQSTKANDTELTEQHCSPWGLLSPTEAPPENASWLSSPQPDARRWNLCFKGRSCSEEVAGLEQPVRPQGFGCTGWTHKRELGWGVMAQYCHTWLFYSCCAYTDSNINICSLLFIAFSWTGGLEALGSWHQQGEGSWVPNTCLECELMLRGSREMCCALPRNKQPVQAKTNSSGMRINGGWPKLGLQIHWQPANGHSVEMQLVWESKTSEHQILYGGEGSKWELWQLQSNTTDWNILMLIHICKVQHVLILQGASDTI